MMRIVVLPDTHGLLDGNRAADGLDQASCYYRQLLLI